MASQQLVHDMEICDLESGLGAVRVPRQGRIKPWEEHAVDLFERRMLSTSRRFPCVFGVDAVRRGTLRYCFIPAGPDRVPALSSALREYSSRCRDFGNRTSLVAFFEPDESIHTMDGYKREFWRLLNGVAAVDSEPWPAEIDTETESSEWEFCCFGMPFFVVANTPLHEARSSRYFEYFAITFQPRFVFEDLSPDSRTGRNARKVIRARLQQYDTVPAHPQLGGFGKQGNREWVQYFIGDDNTPVPETEKCPFSKSANGPTITGGVMMAEPEITQVAPRTIQLDLLELIPVQGSIELQHDQPGKIFCWHQHDLDEELYVLSGSLTLFWVGSDGSYHERHCEPGARIRLPAGTVHGSTAHGDGAYYIIRPQDGRTAVTTFLPEDHWPYPVVEPAQRS